MSWTSSSDTMQLVVMMDVKDSLTARFLPRLQATLGLAFTDRFDAERFVRMGWSAPSKALADEFLSRKFTTATTECPQVLPHALALGDLTREPRVKAGLKSKHWTELGFTYLEIATPILSADERDALVSVEERSGMLDGVGNLSHFRRDRHGVWNVVGRLRVWIS